jgi:cytidyltransferase-like protein
MIINYQQFLNLRNKVSMVDGGFDPLHIGHIEYFKGAAQLGLPVVCCLASDVYILSKHKPLIPENYRAAIIDSIRYIDYVCINNSSTSDVLQKLQPRYYVKGSDWKNKLPSTETAVCNEFGISIVFLDTVLDSSSRLLKEYLNQGEIK